MPHFDLSPEQQSLIELARDFGEKEMRPHVEHFDQTGEYPWPIIKKLMSLVL